jgi:hypothetical protein
MRVTPWLGKGFFGRSLDEFQRLSKIGIIPCDILQVILSDIELMRNLYSSYRRRHQSTNRTLHPYDFPRARLSQSMQGDV